MTIDATVTRLPSSYTELVIEKSNLLLRANMLEAQEKFDEAAEIFAKAARMEAKLATIAQQYGQPDTALVHLISEMSCWAAAGDTYRALSQGHQVLTMTTLTATQQAHIRDFVEQLNQRRRIWMESWHHRVAVAA